MSESVDEKARRYVDENRVKIWASSWRGVTADVVGTDGVYRVGWDRDREWVCSCPAMARCSHIAATAFVFDPEEEQMVTPPLPPAEDEDEDPERPFVTEDREPPPMADNLVPTIPPGEGYEDARLAHDADAEPPALETVDVATGEIVARPIDPFEADLQAAPFTMNTVKAIADTELVTASLRGRPYAMLAAIRRGLELGLGPMDSLGEIAAIDGSYVLSAEIQLALYRRAGHGLTIQRADHLAVALRGKRGDNGDTAEVVYELADAANAGLLTIDDKGNVIARTKQGKAMPWEKYTADMLWARAVTRLVSRLAPDALRGWSLPR